MSAAMRPPATLFILLAVGLGARAANPKPSPAPRNASAQSLAADISFTGARDCSIEEYQAHLAQLQSLVTACARHLGTQSCDPGRVGLDDNVSTDGGKRLVSYTWLREVLASAIKPSGAAVPATIHDNAGNKPPDVALLLEEARRRLLEEQKLSAQTQALPDVAKDQAQARRNLAVILAASEFQRVRQPNLLQRSFNLIVQWLFEKLTGLAGYSSRARWITRLFLVAALLAGGVLLAWWFIAQRRRQRLALWPSSESPVDRSSGGVWRQWLDEAQLLSQAGRWREAIHSIYWAAIALLESRGLWRQDRARTPREYLAVLHPGNASRSPLAALTRTFERTWYGHDPAGQQEYERARELLERLAS